MESLAVTCSASDSRTRQGSAVKDTELPTQGLLAQPEGQEVRAEVVRALQAAAELSS